MILQEESVANIVDEDDNQGQIEVKDVNKMVEEDSMQHVLTHEAEDDRLVVQLEPSNMLAVEMLSENHITG